MRSARTSALLLALGLALPLTHCADDDGASTPVTQAGSSGEAGEASGGDAGASTSHGGSADGSDGGHGNAGGASNGSAGEAQGGTDGGNTAGGGGAAGGAGSGGACTAIPDPTHCCDPGDPPCGEDWELGCYGSWPDAYTCCDAELGARRSCTNDGDYYYFDDVVCVNECTGKSFGTTTCSECYVIEASPCGADGRCELGQEACFNASAGYGYLCVNNDQQLICVCDPDL